MTASVPIRILGSLLVLSLVVTVTAAGQQRRRGLVEVSSSTRHGFWVGFGLGAGGESYDLGDGYGYTSTLTKPTFTLELGGTVGSHLRLGGEITSWVWDRGDRTESLSSFLAVARVYPLSRAGLYFKGGLGLGRSAVDFPDGYSVSDGGFAGAIGAGWEVRLGRRFFLVPAVDLIGQRFTQPNAPDVTERLAMGTIGVVFQP
jgi:hypothetical protein